MHIKHIFKTLTNYREHTHFSLRANKLKGTFLIPLLTEKAEAKAYSNSLLWYNFTDCARLSVLLPASLAAGTGSSSSRCRPPASRRSLITGTEWPPCLVLCAEQDPRRPYFLSRSLSTCREKLHSRRASERLLITHQGALTAGMWCLILPESGKITSLVESDDHLCLHLFFPVDI